MRDEQQMARVNVDLETWQTFRIEAIRRGRSIADWLGELVQREVARLDGTSSRGKATGDDATTSNGSESTPTEPAKEQPEQPARRRPRRETVAGQPLLTELPHAGSKPPPWEL